ncbi:MAG: MobV family relaxase [Cyanobacteria bacterium P01_F01_bin.86]
MGNISYAVVRVGKRFKTSGQLAACDQHNQRSQETPNADINRVMENECFVGDNDQSLWELVFSRIGNNGGKKIRESADMKQSAVLAFELMLTASPQYFRPDTPGDAGVWQLDKLQAWESVSAAWVKDKFGVNLVRATFHRDESTPHIHAVIVPMNEKGHLCAKDFVGSRSKLIALQDSYAEAMKPLGLSRGIRGSKAQHEDIKEFYKSVNQDLDAAYTPEQVSALAADRQRQVQKRNEMERTAFALSEENAQLKDELSLLKSEIQQLQRLLNQSHSFRLTPLEEIAKKLGLQPSEFDPSRWRNERVYIRIDGTQFSMVGEPMKGHGAIDLVMRVRGDSFADALVWLERQFGAGIARAFVTAQADIAASAVDAARLKLPVKSEPKWLGIRKHIFQQNYLPSKMLEALYEKGLVYASEDGQVVFIERDLKGEVAGATVWNGVGSASPQESRFERVENSADNAAFYVVVPDNMPVDRLERVVVTDTPIEALSKRVLETGGQVLPTKYIAVDGPKAVAGHSTGINRVEIALNDERAAQAVYKLIPDAINAQPLESHQAQLRREMETLTRALRQPMLQPKTQQRSQQKGLER